MFSIALNVISCKYEMMFYLRLYKCICFYSESDFNPPPPSVASKKEIMCTSCFLSLKSVTEVEMAATSNYCHVCCTKDHSFCHVTSKCQKTTTFHLAAKLELGLMFAV